MDTVIKSKYHEKKIINIEQERKVAVSYLIPEFEKLCSAKQVYAFSNCRLFKNEIKILSFLSINV